MSHNPAQYRRSRMILRKRLTWAFSLAAFCVLAYSGVSAFAQLFTPNPTFSVDDPEALDKIRALPVPDKKKALAEYGRTLAENRVPPPRPEPGKAAPKNDPKQTAFHKAMKTLSKEERRAVHNGAREVFRKKMDERIEAYFQLSEAERTAALDRQLDQMAKRMKEQPKRRDASTKTASKNEKQDNRKNPERKKPSVEERLNHFRGRLNDTTPAERAQHQAYFAAIKARAEERGIALPQHRRPH